MRVNGKSDLPRAPAAAKQVGSAAPQQRCGRRTTQAHSLLRILVFAVPGAAHIPKELLNVAQEHLR